MSEFSVKNCAAAQIPQVPANVRLCAVPGETDHEGSTAERPLHVRVPVRPSAVPVELHNLTPDTIVLATYGDPVLYNRRASWTVGDLVVHIKETIQRQSEGKFLIWEAAHLIAEAQGLDAHRLLNRMEAAFESGELTVREPGSQLRRHKTEKLGRIRDIVYERDINTWLAEDGVDYRFPPLQKHGDGPCAETPNVQGDYPYDLLATRRQLVDAFGRFVGMDLSWFKSLNDAPALRDARKIVGRSGKFGHATEPMFCPFEVMTYVTKPGRRVKRPLSEEKAWGLLEHHFPKVYAAKQIGDPRSIS